ncbi:MAG: PqiC family protein [Deltaproteobacteria bacterium]|jgi:uncharacterized lipoprotein YmbA|nr:PqiC family protein [Deltaproteobacteria bacterium]
MLKTTITLLLVAILALAFTACGLSQRPYPLVRTYTLEQPDLAGAMDQALSKRPKAVVIVTASPPPSAYDGKKLVYKQKPHELAPDFYNEFYAPPTRAIADSLAKYLDMNSPKLQIVRFQGASSPDYSLEVGIMDLYGDYTVSPPVLRLTVTTTMNDLRRSVTKVVFANRYVKTPPLVTKGDEDRPETLVRTITEALAELYPSILADTESAASGR